MALIGGVLAIPAAFIGRQFWVKPGYQEIWASRAIPSSLMLAWRTSDLGELFQNVAASAFHPRANSLPIGSMSYHELLAGEFAMLSYLVGAAAIGLILIGLWRVGRPTDLHVYLCGWICILSVWPYHDLRFWAPVLPFLFAAAWIGWLSAVSRPMVRLRAARAYCVVFLLVGMIAMAESLRVSLIERERTATISREWILGRQEWKAARLFLD
jgi:hypothetical protein